MSAMNPYGRQHSPGGYPKPFQIHSETSREAAESIPEALRIKLQRDVYRYLLRTGGGTDEAGIAALCMSPSTYRPRRCELVDEGYVRDSGRKVRGNSGRPMVVWCITDKGRA